MPDPQLPPVYEPIYTTYDDLFRLLGANKLSIRIGSELSDHITEDDARYHIRDTEGYVTSQLSKRYVTPLVLDDLSADAVRTLANVALYRSAYTLWLTVPGAQYQGEIPRVVQEWQKLGDELLADVVAGKIPLYGATSLVGAGPSLPAYESRRILYPKSRSETIEVDDDDLVETEGGLEIAEGDILDGSGI